MPHYKFAAVFIKELFMYVLPGMIHLLLMLTQSRFTPDLGMLFREETTATGVVTTCYSPSHFQLPVEKTTRFSFEMVRPGDKEKLRQVLQAEAKAFIHVQKIKRNNRAHSSKKLYLLLGQLKTEG